MKQALIKLFCDAGYSFHCQTLIDGKMQLEFLKEGQVVKVQYITDKCLVTNESAVW